MHPKPLIPPQEFNARVVPELLRRYDMRCFCRNPNFLKLVSFNFQDYNIAPMVLYDSEFVIYEVALKRFEPVREWGKNPERIDRCKQCGTEFRTCWDQYSINMDRTVMLPVEKLPMAATGLYVTGFRYFAKDEHELAKITDFEVAGSVEAFVEAITGR
jgi:hypothetical protein